MAELVSCVDFGSTFTKGALIDARSGELVATASHRTTLDTDVLDGWDAIRAEFSTVLGDDPGRHADPRLLVGRRRTADRCRRE
jgi:MutL protein